MHGQATSSALFCRNGLSILLNDLGLLKLTYIDRLVLPAYQLNQSGNDNSIQMIL